MKFVKVKPEEIPKPKPPPKGGDAAKSMADISPTVVPPVSAPSVVVSSTINPNFSISSPSMNVNSTMLPPSLSVPTGEGLGSGSTGGGPPQSNPFGETVDTAGAPLLVGYMFDLKQTPEKRATGIDLPHFYEVLGNFATNHFDETVLNGYYRTRNELGTAEISIPFIHSIEAPKAFHVENEVQASLWMAHYHATVAAPESGDYTFVGTADNVIVVAMDGKLVLDAGITHVTQDSSIRTIIGFRKPYLYMKGKTFHANAGQPMQMDVLIGDDGGACCFHLFIMKDGVTYQREGGAPTIPLFRVNDTAGLDFPVQCPPWEATATATQ